MEMSMFEDVVQQDTTRTNFTSLTMEANIAQVEKMPVYSEIDCRIENRLIRALVTDFLPVVFYLKCLFFFFFFFFFFKPFH